MFSQASVKTVPPSRSVHYTRVKRVLDALGGFLALVALSPAIVLVALVVLALDGRPVFFFQKRPGLGAQTFILIKFRTMAGTPSANSGDETRRITPLGRRLRSLSLDELPSLWNVLRGDMSFIGPRPLLLNYVEIFSSHHARRHLVRPGLTGLAQVSGRNFLSWKERLDLDVTYVDSLSLLTDIKILSRTIKVVFLRRGINQMNGLIMEPLREGYDSQAER